MGFRPEGHEQFNVGNYMRFTEGPNKIRILKEPITGYLHWKDASGNIVARNAMGGAGSTPVRMKAEEEFSTEQSNAMKMFSAMIVTKYLMRLVGEGKLGQKSWLWTR